MADIPLFKLQHPQIRQLFTHLGQSVPSESSCREHVDKLAVDEKQRFLVVDESEIDGSKYLNIFSVTQLCRRPRMSWTAALWRQ